MKNNRLRSFRHVFGLLLILAAAASGKSVEYKITVDPADLSGCDVEIILPDTTGSIRLAMAAHPEHDDRYFRYVENFTAEAAGRRLPVTKSDPAVWQVDGVRGTLTVRYRIVPAAKEREWKQAWRPFLTPTGGMIGDLHTLMYPIGRESDPARLTLSLPIGWAAASGLKPTSNPTVFTGFVEDMLDAPVIVGKFDEWKFDAGGVPHQIVIWSPADSKPLDPKPIVAGIKKLTDESIKALGKPPYARYAFLLENGGSAALEHKTSLNAGISGDLADLFDSIGHEYIHVWNLMDVRPRERIGVRYKYAEPTNVLWWSEGATIMFSDLFIRRAGIPGETRSRTERLESVLARYYSSPGYWKLSAEAVSRGDSHPELLGDSFASTHLQGEVLVTMLDLMIRDKTDNRRSATDAMKLLAERFDSRRGIDNADIEKALADTCGCDVRPFFGEHIYSAGKIDLDRYLGLIGMRARIGSTPAVDRAGSAAVDLRIGPVSDAGPLKLRMLNSESAWARAGLTIGDVLLSVNGAPMSTWNEFRSQLVTLRIGDTMRVAVSRDGVPGEFPVTAAGFNVATVDVADLPSPTAKQLRLRQAWLASR